MALVGELLTDDWKEKLSLSGPRTGLQDLDDLTGGLRAGTLWVLVGTPGVGRTVLATQIAGEAARAGTSSVTFLSGRGEPDVVLSNLLCAGARVPLHRLHRQELSADDRQRLDHAAAELAGLPLQILSPTHRAWPLEGREVVADFGWMLPLGRPTGVLVVDDVDLVLAEPLLGALPRLRTWCAAEHFALVLTVPEEGLVDGRRAHPDLRRHTDVLLRLHRDDHFEPDHPRNGEADLQVLRHRRGPTADIALCFVGFAARFQAL